MKENWLKKIDWLLLPMIGLVAVIVGWYVLSASVPAMTDGKQSSITTYYPGTQEMAYATPIEVGKATVHEGFDFIAATE